MTSILPELHTQALQEPLRELVQPLAGHQTTKVLKLGFVGAGGINFGSPEGPWNHAARLETFPDVEFTCIIDPQTKLALKRVEDHQGGKYGKKWQNTKIFKNYKEVLEGPNKPDALFVGLPPSLHGSLDDPNADIEIQLARAGIHVFVEKPVSLKPVEEVQRLAEELKEVQQDTKAILAVGYMLRYSPAVDAAKEIIEKYDAKPISVSARYAGTYPHITKRYYWDSLHSGGPIVEQATHFVDLMRYLVGNIQKESVSALAVTPQQLSLRELSPLVEEHTIPEERKINRATSAVFRFDNGLTLGTLNNTVLLHEANYHTVLEIVCDGLHVIIDNPYAAKPDVQFRPPKSQDYQQANVKDGVDMYEAQLRDFVNAIRTQDQSKIRSPYHDAVKTYETTRWITEASMPHNGH